MSSAYLKNFAQIKAADIDWQNGLPYSREFDDVYFSSDGGCAESEHVFIQGNRLIERWQTDTKNPFTIVELGFGSGLNYLLTAHHWQQHLKRQASNAGSGASRLHYVSIEKRPFNLADFKRASQHWPAFKTTASELITSYPSLTYGRHQFQFDSLNINLTLMFMPVDDALSDLLNESGQQSNKIAVDAWFLDGFAPAKNQSMWHAKLCQNIAHLSAENTSLATYSVAAAVKQPLKDAGFEIKKRKGFGRKREMLTATYPLANQGPLTASSKKPQAFHPAVVNIKHQRPWFNISQSEPGQKIAIIGGGLAGCATAYQLTRRGFAVDLFEAESQLASKASGAAAGIFHPQLTTDMNHHSQFHWLGYLKLLDFLARLSEKQRQQIVICQSLTKILASSDLQQQIIEFSQQLMLTPWLRPASDRLIEKLAIDFPDAAALNITQLSKTFLAKIAPERLKLFLNSPVNRLQKNNRQWQLSVGQSEQVFNYQQVIFCGGAHSSIANQFLPEATHVSRGQTCLLHSEQLAKAVNRVIVEQVYLVPKGQNEFHLGATFEDFNDDSLSKQSQQALIKKSAGLFEQYGLSKDAQNALKSAPIKGTVGYRLHTQDRMPLVGGVVNQDKIAEDFADLGQKRLFHSDLSTYNQPGLWLNTAYGSHGLINALVSSQHLAALIGNDISPLTTRLANALHPARFKVKKLKSSASNKA